MSAERDEGRCVLVRSNSLTVYDPRFRRAVYDVVRSLRSTRRAADIRSPYSAGAGRQISVDGRSVLVLFKVRGDVTALDGPRPPVRPAPDIRSPNAELTITEFMAPAHL